MTEPKTSSAALTRQTWGPHWLTFDEAKQINNLLIDVWEDGEAIDDAPTVAEVKKALDALRLPWVRL